MPEIRIGILHSLTGTMAVSESSLVDAAMMAIGEINESGGVLGRQVRAVIEDGQSSPEVFAAKAEKMIVEDRVESIFGCWTSSSRKAVKPVVEKHRSLLWYPVQYEGFEQSPNIAYTGSCLNQQIYPAIRWAMDQGHRTCFLVGSDYVFPRTANRLIRTLVSEHGGEILGEEYRDLGDGRFGDILETIRMARPDIVFNTINGEDNIAFFRQHAGAGMDSRTCPVMSFSFSETELRNVSTESVGHFACWSYFQSLTTPENVHFLGSWRKACGKDSVSSDPVATAYSQIHLWRNVAEQTGSVGADAVRRHLGESVFTGPCGEMHIRENNHVAKPALIGRSRENGQFEVVWRSDESIEPEPWLGVEKAGTETTGLVLEALSQLPEVVHLNSILKNEIRKREETEVRLHEHEESLETLVQKRTEELTRSNLSLQREITKRRQSEEKVQHQNTLLGFITDNIPSEFFVKDRQSRFLMASRTVLDSLDLSSPGDIVGKSDFDFSSPEKAQAQYEEEQRIMETGEAMFSEEKEGIHPGEPSTWYLSTKVPIRNEAGEVTGLVGMNHYITDRKRAEEALQRSEERLRAIVENVGVGVAIIRSDMKVLFLNPQMQKWFPGVDLNQEPICFEAYNDPPRVSPCPLCPAVKTLQDGQSYEITDERPTGENGPTYRRTFSPIRDESGEVWAFVEMVEDISDRRKAEEERRSLEAQVQHSQKLESLGVLAGGIAHDFNNLLMGILGNADLALQELSPLSPARENIDGIETAARRAADLSKQMLAYSGKGRFQVQTLAVNELVEEMGHLLEVSISKKAVLKYNLQKSLPAIEADAVQVRQVVMNLITNASEAIGDENGVISITTGAMECDAAYLQETYLDENLPEGAYVHIEVADTGCGMDEETRAKLFDPFFTTKFSGRGLGMSAVLGIVRGHKGAIKVYSEPGQGTTFKVLFPAVEGLPEELAGATASAAAWRGEGTVLLVDDEETVRGVGKQMLMRMGFTVLTAQDGREAVRLLGEQEERVACVLLDLTMPHMDGEETFRELRKQNPDLPVVMSSGYNEQEVTQRFLGRGLAGFIQKPYTLANLRAKMKQALEG